MPTRSHSASTSLRMCDERNTVPVRPSGLADRVPERRLHQRVEAARRLVQDEQRRGGSRTRRSAGSSAGCPWSSRARACAGRTRTARSASGGTPRRRIRAGGPGTRGTPRPVSAGQSIGSPATKATRRCASTGSRQASIAEERRVPVARALQPEEQPDRGGLPRAVRTEESVHLAGGDRRGRARVERDGRAVALGQARAR